MKNHIKKKKVFSRMASRRFGGLVLGVIIVSLALKYSSACAQEGVERKGKWLPSFAQNHASSQNDLHEDAAVATIAGRKVLVGRNTRKGKMLKREIEIKEGSIAKPEISGKGAPKKSVDGAEHSHMNIQDNSNGSQKGPKEYASKNPRYSPNSASLFAEHYDENADTREFLKAADDEVVNLMRKDYRGWDRPRRKPPINNHEPID